MPTDIHHPTTPLPPRALDSYLSRGWRPTGQSLYFCHFLRTDEEEIHGCVQLRLPLAKFSSSARQRKLLRRNGRRFTHTINRAEWPDQEILRVNDAYRRLHPEKSREDLQFHLLAENGRPVLDTRIVRVFEEGKLVAFSYFDCGARALYSKAGIYDPSYRDASLGVYTMLLELEFARQHGFDYYHPGYFSPTYPKFDYKLRLGNYEYLDVNRHQWLPVGDRATAAERVPDPYAVSRQKLLRLSERLRFFDHILEVREYASFTARYRPLVDTTEYLDGAIVGLSRSHDGGRYGSHSIVNYNFETGRYQFLRGHRSTLYDMNARHMGRNGLPRYNIILTHGEPLYESPDEDGLVSYFLDTAVDYKQQDQ